MRNDAEPPLGTLQINLRSVFVWLTVLAVFFAVVRLLPLPREIVWANVPSALCLCFAILGGLYFIARSPFIASSLIAGSIGTWFGGSLFGVLFSFFIKDIPFFGQAFCAVIGLMWAGMFSMAGLGVAGLVVILVRPRGRVWPSALCGAVTGGLSLGIISLPDLYMTSIVQYVALCLYPAIVGAATAAFATIVHLWAKRNRNFVRGELPEKIFVPDQIAPPASEDADDGDESFRLRDELE